jgi:uncharacterized membrane protein YdfJ with MMPL/SSD domain
VLLGRWNWWPSRVTIDQPDLAAGRPEAIEPQADHIG